MENKERLKVIVKEILDDSFYNMDLNIDKVLNSGAIDIDNWNPNHNSMILPKCIVLAILKNECLRYDAKGTSYQRLVNKEVKNIMYFI